MLTFEHGSFAVPMLRYFNFYRMVGPSFGVWPDHGAWWLGAGNVRSLGAS